MRISPINNIDFKSNRQDRNYVKCLSVAPAPINENLERNIALSLEALSQNPSDDNIRFLLSTAQNLAYGIPHKSAFREQLLSSSPIKNLQQSNTDWELRLQHATQSAIKKNQSEQKDALQQEFDKTFFHKSALSPTQRSILNNRKKILHNPILQISENNHQTQNVRKNLDYFIFSSEISIEDKLYCLEKISNFLSKNYRINPQLKDKKLQILDEILNDIIIKTPQEAANTIKNVNQRHHGMCAAISACRKLLAYTDKRNYIDNIFEELNASPTMNIFDITQLGSGIKIPVEKVFIDFTEALAQNYRIIDASALQWMQNASRTGDGNIKIYDYVPFDKANYEIYSDSFWISGFPQEAQNIHEMLKSTIKARNYATQIHQKQAHFAAIKDDYRNNGISSLNSINRLNRHLENNLSLTMPDKSISEIKSIAYRLLNLSKGSQYVYGANYKYPHTEDSSFIINPDEPDTIQKEKIKNFLLQFSSKEQVNKYIDRIFDEYTMINSDINTSYKNIKREFSPRNIARYYKLLFKYATAYQDALEKNLDELPYATQCLAIYNLETRKTTIRNHFKSILKELKKEHNPQDYILLAKLLKTNPNREELFEKMQNFSNKFESTVNKKQRKIMKQLGFANEKEMAIRLIEAYIENIKTNDKEEIAQLSKTYKINPTKFAVIKHLNKMLTEIKNETFKGNFESILSDFKIKDEITFLSDITSLLSTLLEHPEAQLENPKPIFFFTKSILNNSQLDLTNTLPETENEIATLQNYVTHVEEKFNVPTSKDIVLAYLKKQNNILNANEFEILNKKFLAISQYEDALNDSSEKLHNTDIYLFTKQEKELINKILHNFNKSEQYVNGLYNAINRKFKDELSKIYNETGRLNGDFWTREEGSSGLYDGQEIKILEQMTGRPFYIETDLKKAVEELKKGAGGGEINTCVCDDEFSGHAQFLYATSPIQMLDNKTKQKKSVDVLWHDNSWGKSERKNSWTDEHGLERTNYGNATGGANGFIVRDNDTTGWDIDYAMYGKGINKPQQINNPRENKYYKFVGEEYSLFSSIMLPGESDISKEKAYRLAQEILKVNPTKKTLKNLFSKIDNGEIPNLKNYGEIFDKTINTHIERIINETNKINSEQELLSLPENNPIKIILQKMAILKTPYGKANQDIIDNITTQKEIDKYNQSLLNKLKLFTKGYLEQNSMLVYSEELKRTLLEYISDFEKDNNCKYPQLKSYILKALRIQENEINGNLKANVMNNISIALDKTIRNPQHKSRIKSDILQLFSAYYDRTFSSESILLNKDFTPILNLIDRKFHPESDEQVKDIIELLRRKNKSEINALLAETTLEDFGIKYQPEYHILKVIQSKNHEATDNFNSALFSYFAYDILPKDPKMKVALGNTYDNFIQKYDKSADTLYRSLYVNLSYAEIDGIINKHKEEYLKKYSIRASFPNVKYHSEKDIYEATEKNLETLRTIIKYFKDTNEEGKLIDLIETLKSYNFDKIPPTEEFYKTNIYPLCQAIQKNNAISYLSKDCIDTLSQINNSENTSTNDRYNMFKTLISQLEEIEPTFNKKTLQKERERYKEKLKEIIQGSCDGFVSNPNQKNQMIKLIKQYIKAISKNKPEYITNKLENKIKEHACKHYALKNPTKLLDEIIKLKIQDKMNGTNANKNKIELGIKLLNEALDSAHKTEIECKIMDEINSGRIYDLKKNLQNFTFVTEDGATNKILSDTGIYIMFDALYSPDTPNPMSSVNLLCQHSGLSEDFFRILSDKFETKKFTTLFLAFRERAMKIKNETDLCRKIFKKMISQTPTNYYLAAQSYIKTLQETFGNKTKVMQEYINDFKNFADGLENLSKTISEKESLSQQQKEKITKELLEYTHQKSLNNIVYNFSSRIKSFNDYSSELENGINIIENLKLSKFSPQQETKNILLETLNKLNELGSLIGEEIEITMKKLYKELDDNIKISV